MAQLFFPLITNHEIPIRVCFWQALIFGIIDKNERLSDSSALQTAVILCRKSGKITKFCLFVHLFCQTTCKIAKKIFFVILHGQKGCFPSIMPLQSIRSTFCNSKFFSYFIQVFSHLFPTGFYGDHRKREVAQIRTKLAILDKEIGEGLCTYLMLRDYGLQPVLCESEESMLDSDAPIGLIGAGYTDAFSGIQEAAGDKQLLLLGTGALDPYQPADELIRALYRELLERQISLPGALRTLYGDKELVAVCSPHSYDRQSDFAVVYSLLRAQEIRTLYLDFTYYNGFFDCSDKDVGDLFYELHKHVQPMERLLPAFVHSCQALDYIPPVRVQMDLEDLTGKDFTQLFEQLLQESEYGLIVVNMPCRPSFLRAAYEGCSCMYSLQREGMLYDRAQTRLLEDLGLEGEKKSHSNLKVVELPAIGGSFSMDSSMYEELLFGEMAALIKKEVLCQDTCRRFSKPS